jgi:hypothetical protein
MPLYLPNRTSIWLTPATAAPSARAQRPLKSAPLPAGNATGGPAVEHGRGEDAERRLVAHTQLREIRPILALEAAQQVSAKPTCASSAQPEDTCLGFNERLSSVDQDSSVRLEASGELRATYLLVPKIRAAIFSRALRRRTGRIHRLAHAAWGARWSMARGSRQSEGLWQSRLALR